MIKLQVIGNVGQNARVNDVNGNKSINFSVAYNRKYADKDGVEVEQTTWVNCTFWKRAGQSVEIAKYLTAGTKVYIEGTPEIDLYTDKQGKPAASLKCNVYQVELLNASKKEEPEPKPEEEKKI